MEKKFVKGFYQESKCQYGEITLKQKKDVLENFMIGFYNGEGTKGELSIDWIKSSTRVPMPWKQIEREPYLQVSVCGDAFKLFKELPELFDLLSTYHRKYISPDDFVKELEKLNYKNFSK